MIFSLQLVLLKIQPQQKSLLSYKFAESLLSICCLKLLRGSHAIVLFYNEDSIYTDRLLMITSKIFLDGEICMQSVSKEGTSLCLM